MSLAACAIHTAYNKEKNKNVGEKSMRQTFAPNEKKVGPNEIFLRIWRWAAGALTTFLLQIVFKI